MKAEQLIQTYKTFIEMCLAKDITDVADVQFLFKLHIEQQNAGVKK